LRISLSADSFFAFFFGFDEEETDDGGTLSTTGDGLERVFPVSMSKTDEVEAEVPRRLRPTDPTRLVSVVDVGDDAFDVRPLDSLASTGTALRAAEPSASSSCKRFHRESLS
jgi:hypothetical protein